MSGGVEVVVFPRIAGVQWSDTVVSTLWEGGMRRSRPRHRPWSCEDCAGRPIVSLQAAWSWLMYGLPYTARWRSVGPAD